MNRLALPTTNLARLATSAPSAQPHTIDDLGCHALFAPEHYEPAYGYPLIVWLHGEGNYPAQLGTVMRQISLRNYVAVAPRGTLAANEDIDADDATGYTWRQDADHILLARQRTSAAILAATEHFRIAPSKVVLVGSDAGGTMALRLAFDDPQQFAGVVSLGGAFPTGMAPLCRLNAVRRVPVLLSTGRCGATYGDPEVAADLRLLHSAGISVTVRLYPCGDGVTSGMLADVNRWVMQHVCPQQSSPAPQGA